MIADAVLSWVTSIIHSALGGLPKMGPPDWLTTGSSAVSAVFSMADSMGAWFPGGLALTVILALLGVWVVGFGIKVVRMALSLFTGGGGSAA